MQFIWVYSDAQEQQNGKANNRAQSRKAQKDQILTCRTLRLAPLRKISESETVRFALILSVLGTLLSIYGRQPLAWISAFARCTIRKSKTASGAVSTLHYFDRLFALFNRFLLQAYPTDSLPSTLSATDKMRSAG